MTSAAADGGLCAIARRPFQVFPHNAPACTGVLTCPRPSGSGPTRDDCRTTHAGLPNQTASCKPSVRPNRIYVNFVAENAPPRTPRSRRVGRLRYLNHGMVREFDSNRKETHSAQADAGSIALLRATPKYRLLERYVALNVNDEK
jgi:hypothetical protein